MKSNVIVSEGLSASSRSKKYRIFFVVDEICKGLDISPYYIRPGRRYNKRMSDLISEVNAVRPGAPLVLIGKSAGAYQLLKFIEEYLPAIHSLEIDIVTIDPHWPLRASYRKPVILDPSVPMAYWDSCHICNLYQSAKYPTGAVVSSPKIWCQNYQVPNCNHRTIVSAQMVRRAIAEKIQ